MYRNSLNQILIVGAGAFGRALASAIKNDSNEVSFLVRNISEVIAEIEKLKFKFKNIQTISEFDGNLISYDLVIFAIPTQSLRSVLVTLRQKFDSYLKNNHIKFSDTLPFVSTSKGIEQNTIKLPHEIFNEVFGGIASVAALSGPSFSKELIRQLPTCLTIASAHETLIQKCIAIMHSTYFRLYDSQDIIGVEVGGALKNVVALLTGIIDGLDLGQNAKSAIITLGLSDITHIGVHMGASPFTFMGLSGLGDLILTCTGDLSRNKQFGKAFAKSGDHQKIIEEMGGVVEGFATTKSAHQLMNKYNITSPLLDTAYKILYENLPLEKAMKIILNHRQGCEFHWLKEFYGSQFPSIKETTSD